MPKFAPIQSSTEESSTKRKDNTIHAYDKDGKPCYTVVGKNGKERSTWIKDVKERGWYPSVTEVDGATSNKDFLVTWKVGLAIDWCLENPFNVDVHSVEEYLSLAKEAANKKSEEAMAFGTALHDAIENYLRNNQLPDNPLILDYWTPVREWIDREIIDVIATEVCRTCPPLGIGGTIDLIAETRQWGTVLLDWKSQKIPRRKNRITKIEKLVPRIEDKWVRQLGCYSAMWYLGQNGNCPVLSEDVAGGLYQDRMLPCVSVAIDSVEPGFIHPVPWSREDQAWGLQCMIANTRAWVLTNRYSPPDFIL